MSNLFEPILSRDNKSIVYRTICPVFEFLPFVVLGVQNCRLHCGLPLRASIRFGHIVS